TWYEASKTTLEKLRKAKVPPQVVNNLKPLAARGPLDEDTFMQSLKESLDAELLKAHRETILAAVEKSTEPWEGTMAVAMQAALCSPSFLFRAELESKTAGKEPQPIDDYALASRLSYFIWSSMPDSELLELAAKKQLHSNIPGQVKRMLADPRSRALFENFAEQWLELRALKHVQPDPKALNINGDDFRRLRDDMLTETRLFFEAILREDRSILDLIDGKFTYLNSPLANHYRIKDTNGNSYNTKEVNPPGKPITGREFVRVSLENTPRGGILTHGSVLTITSMPARTSIPKRGAWVLERILGTPPPPPPAMVPELEKQDDVKDKKAVLSLRKKLERHRVESACAGCHARMDPIGFAFENFDAIGRFRDRENNAPIDVSGELPGGVKFNSPEGLKAILLAKKELFARCLTEKLLTYAIGRSVEYYDKRSVDSILVSLEKNDYRIAALIAGIVQSEPFRLRRGKDQGQ
ncbi:MAG: DUF1592 domain-containing protein, partial [Planctomycetota bacterium]